MASLSPLIAIRERTDADFHELGIVLRATHAKTGYPVVSVNEPTTFLTPSSTLKAWVATFNDKVVGHILVEGPSISNQAIAAHVQRGGDLDHVAVLARLFVSPDTQGLGLGKLLIKHAVAWAHSVGKRLVLYVLDKDIVATGMYEKLGWNRISEGTFEAPEKVWRTFSYVSPIP